MNSADRQELAAPQQSVACGGFYPLETLCLLLSFKVCLTLTELPVLGDHLAVAAVAVTGIGAIVVYTAALPFAWVLVTLIHVCNGRRRKTVQKRLNAVLNCRSISPAETVHFPNPDSGEPLLHRHSSVMGLSPVEAEQRPRPSP